MRPPPRLLPSVERLAPLGLALASSGLAGCTDEQFEDFMTTLVVGLVAVLAVAICMGIINLVILGGGLATVAINLVGTPTERSRTLGFVFGGLNLASGLLGLLSLAGGAAYVAQLPVASGGSADPMGELMRELPTLIVMSLMSLGTLALGIAGIVVAARAKPAGSPPAPVAPPPPDAPPPDAPWG